MGLQLTFVTLDQEVDLLVLLEKGCVQVVDFLQKSLLNQLTQLPNVTDSVFRFRDQLLTIGNSPVFVAAMRLPDLIPEIADKILESGYFFVLLALDMLKFGSQCIFYGFLVRNGSLELFDLPFELLL